MTRTLSARRRFIAVLCGGFIGAIIRFLLSTAIQSVLGKQWPYDILLINVTGAFILALVTPLADATLLIGPTRRLFINVGFLGAYTTFSSLALGDVLLLMNGHLLAALIYLLASLVGGLLAVLLGDALGNALIMKSGRFSSPLTTGQAAGGHLDIQDDILITEQQEREPRPRHPS